MMRQPIIDATYMPFSREQLRRHFTRDADGQIAYFETSARRYQKFLQEHPDRTGISLSHAKVPRQIEKDEKFWTLTCLKSVFDDPRRSEILTALLKSAFGDHPAIAGLSSWDECLVGDMELYFEAQLPSPQRYVAFLREHLKQRQMIPYVMDAAARKTRRPLEGPTHVDAIILNTSNGFALLFEAKVLSDIAPYVSFDNFRNQLARNIDVMLEDHPSLDSPLSRRRSEHSLFALLTPAGFREYPSSRLYGWLMREYQNNPKALARDLPHRERLDWTAVSRRLGWITYDEINGLSSGACPWLAKS